MAVQVIINQQQGPLPIKTSFMAPGDAPMYIEVTGSVWTQTQNNLIGIEIQIDGQVMGIAHVYSNGNSTHRAVVPAYVPVKLTQGQHTLTLSPAPNTSTVSDANDYFTAVIHY